LFLESMAESLLAGFTNNLRYRDELKAFFTAVRLQPSAKAALNMMRGPMGQGKKEKATKIDETLHCNVMGVPSERSFKKSPLRRQPASSLRRHRRRTTITNDLGSANVHHHRQGLALSYSPYGHLPLIIYKDFKEKKKKKKVRYNLPTDRRSRWLLVTSGVGCSDWCEGRVEDRHRSQSAKKKEIGAA
jgi:hypothetical protein